MLKRLLRPVQSGPRAPFLTAPPPRAPGAMVLSEAWWQWLSAMASGASGEGPRDVRELRSRP
jgi:hypothetical protein